jgi:hypothetical protein
MRTALIILSAVILISGFIVLVCAINAGYETTGRNYINKKIIEMFKAGRSDDVYNFYNEFIKNKEAAICVVNTALIFDIPIHYFTGLACQESSFRVKVKSKIKPDGSFDIGLFQLNTKVYNKYSTDYLLEIKNNVRLAGAHLTDNYLQVKNWYSALGVYNSGNENNINFNHVRNILLYADKLDEEFSKIF